MGALPVLIVARPGRTRDGLQALLTAITQVTITGLADDIHSALGLALDHHPELVLLNGNVCNDTMSDAVSQIKAKWPGTRCLVLVSSVRRQQVARSAGADGVLLRGFPATQFFETVEMLTKENTRQQTVYHHQVSHR